MCVLHSPSVNAVATPLDYSKVPVCKEQKKKKPKKTKFKKGRTAAEITVRTASINHWQINESAIQAEEIKERED